MDEADERAVAEALAEARRAGMSEEEILRLVGHELVLDDPFTAIFVPARLANARSDRDRRSPEP